MPTTKQLGIWMDHSNANLMDLASDPMSTKVIESKFTQQEKENSMVKGESQMHNKEQYLQSEYYKELAAEIKNYENVILFGPTDAKTELLNTLRSDPHFSKIKIETRQADKMTENQQHAFVKQYFKTIH